MNTDYLNLVEARFKKSFPNSHIIISMEKSISQYGTNEQWTLYIVFDELSDEDLQPTKIFEQFSTFNELDKKLSWYMYRESVMLEGIMQEINNN